MGVYGERFWWRAGVNVWQELFLERGHQVILIDNDNAKLERLTHGTLPIHERYLPELISRHKLSGRLTLSALT
jgi:UDP-glucose 6-dehydrogenase